MSGREQGTVRTAYMVHAIMRHFAQKRKGHYYTQERELANRIGVVYLHRQPKGNPFFRNVMLILDGRL